ncbi:related to CGI121 - component of the EKC/KEOPS complex [Ustilago trichophora]|uniref:EKC/KEOPS complex subunit CGI121 n=1 Tax=Ustilago trichophora TaxID=86804 RepID=A0A5C3EMI5_9BASI|nr:related to CGI121 - component of the EKC/KEOPS complex [Ustilago trichophora]
MESILLPSTLPAPLQQVHLAHFSNLDPESQSAAIIRRIISASQLPTSASSGASELEVQAADAERAKLDFAFLDPTKLCSKQHVLSAITQAAIVCARSWDQERQCFREGEGSLGGMKSKTPHSEVIYMLNPGNNVGESLKRFGLSPKSNSLLLVKFSPTTADPTTILQSMLDVVSPQNLTVPPSETSVDIDQAIRYGQYFTPSDPSPSSTLTDWKDLNKFYKLQIPTTLLSHPTAKTTKGKTWQPEYEEIICTSVAMKLVAA